jgi:hypothetical protein
LLDSKEKVIVFSINSLHHISIPFSFEAMDALLNMKRVDISSGKSTWAAEQAPLDVRVMFKSQIVSKTTQADIHAPEHQAPASEQFEMVEEPPPICAPIPVPKMSIPSLTPVAPVLPWEDPLVLGEPTPPAPDFDEFDDDIPF